MRRQALFFASLLSLAACAPKAAPLPPNPAALPPDPFSLRGVLRLRSDAKRLSPSVTTEGTRLFLSRAELLPPIAPRKLYSLADKSRYYTEAQASQLSAEERAALKVHEVNEDQYYNTNFGSPLSYSRALDLLFSHGAKIGPGTRFLDFGYGYIGHLRLLATMGVAATGVDVWPLLPALYSFPGDQGEIAGPGSEKGSVRLLHGRFPADAAIVSEVGSGYDVIISKNVLKKGYIHPDRPVENPKMLISLGASDEVVLRAFYDALAPGGYFLIYNICPALTPPDKPFLPWSDGRAPFTKAQFESAGFEVLALDKDDTDAIRAMGKTLGWDRPEDGEPGMDLQNDLSVLYTLLHKEAKAEASR